MKTISSLTVLLGVATLLPLTAPTFASAEEGVALAIIYDTSGSMRETVPDASGKATPKFVIANRALIAVARRLEAYNTNAATAGERKLDVGLYTFHGESAHAVVPLGPFNSEALQRFAHDFTRPNGNTPLGNSLAMACHAVLKSPLPRKHVLVITDGLNTVGPAPDAVWPGLKKEAETNHSSLSVHFIAFDVDARVFAPLKKLGATVVGAANESQLDSQLDFILQRKILLEEEEPQGARSK